MSETDWSAIVNGVTIMRGEARSLALRLALDHGDDARAAAAASAKLDELAEHGGEANFTGEHAAAVAAALQVWLDETNESVLGERLLALRQRLGGP